MHASVHGDTPKVAPQKGSLKWSFPAAMIALCAIPLIFGVVRLVELAGNPEITTANARFVMSPLPVVLHILGAIAYAILGAFQFPAGFRRRWPGWHRLAGHFLVLCGLVVGLSGIWMTLFYSIPGDDHLLLFAVRLLFGSAMVVSIILGLTAILQRNVNSHKAWMMRAYAIGLGAGTQVFTLMGGELLAGPLDSLGRALLMGLAWGINLAVAEWVIRRRSTSPKHGKQVTVPAQ